MRYVGLLVVALMLGPALDALAAGQFGGGGQVGASRDGSGGGAYKEGGTYAEPTCCTADADVKAIELGLDSPDAGTQDLADEALKKQLRGQTDRD